MGVVWLISGIVLSALIGLSSLVAGGSLLTATAIYGATGFCMMAAALIAPVRPADGRVRVLVTE